MESGRCSSIQLHSLFLHNTCSCFHITDSTNCLAHITINIQTTLRIMTHPAFFLTESSVAVTNDTIFQTIIKKRIQITKYRASFMNGYRRSSYKDATNLIHLGESDDAPTNSVFSSPSNQDARNLADTIIIIHIIPNITNLTHSFIVSSLSDVIILYHPRKATRIQTTINISIIYPTILRTCTLTNVAHFSSVTTSQCTAVFRDVPFVVCQITFPYTSMLPAHTVLNIDKLASPNIESIDANKNFLIAFMRV